MGFRNLFVLDKTSMTILSRWFTVVVGFGFRKSNSKMDFKDRTFKIVVISNTIFTLR